ncbi:MAG: hypothetical protein GF418_03835, partial [Chitinivibrionales bacterium]|nr:hypothetical protein [Chitinivibrionales bacterium]MBD3394736.1 hypothetical protein [Chitinivibrionales bacterium]
MSSRDGSRKAWSTGMRFARERMARGDCVLAVDAGTSSLKAAVVDADLTIVARAQSAYSYSLSGDRGVEIDPEKIWQALVAVSRRLSRYRDRIGTVAACTFCPALTLMDAEGRALRNSIIHLDRRTHTQARRALRQVGEKRFLSITGNLPFPGGISLTSLLWIQEHEPALLKAASQIGHMNTFLLKRLVNRWVTDPTNASMTGLYETVTAGGWHEGLAREFRIDRGKLPLVRHCAASAGKLRAAAARALNLKPGIRVVVGGGDTACAAYGAGDGEAGEVLNIAGSSELLTVTMDKPLPSRRYNLRMHVIPGRWIAFVITVSGIALEWFRNEFCREIDKAWFYREYLPSVLAMQKGGETYTPHLCGDR